MSYFRTQLEEWLKTIDVRADKVLDVGGGALPVKDRVKSWDVNEYKILDNRLEDMKQEPDIIADLNDKHLTATDEGNEQFKQYIGSPVCSGYFDVVFCLEVFEYIYDPVSALENIMCVLKKDGLLYISFPFLYPHHAPESSDYLRYTRWGAVKLLEEAGFKITQIVPRVEVINQSQRNRETDGYFAGLKQWFKSQGMHPARNYPDHTEIGYCIKAVKK